MSNNGEIKATVEKGVKEKSLTLLSQFNNVFLDEDDRASVRTFEDEDLNFDYLVSFLVATKLHFETICEDLEGQDLIEFTHFLNKIAIQFMMENMEE